MTISKRNAGERHNKAVFAVLSPVLLVTISLIAMLSLNRSAASATTNPASWPMYLGGPSHSAYQPGETTISTANAGNLAPNWIAHLAAGPYGSSPVVGNGAVYIGDEGGVLHKYDVGTGASIWSSNLMTNGIYVAPAVGNNQVFAADLSGFVSAVDDLGGANPALLTHPWVPD